MDSMNSVKPHVKFTAIHLTTPVKIEKKTLTLTGNLALTGGEASGMIPSGMVIGGGVKATSYMSQ